MALIVFHNILYPDCCLGCKIMHSFLCGFFTNELRERLGSGLSSTALKEPIMQNSFKTKQMAAL